MGYLSCNAESAIATCDPHSWHLKNKTTTTTLPKPTKITHNSLPPIREFSYPDLLAATNNFSPDTFLGKGSHGSVYKATLNDGTLIAAVKKTKPSSTTPAENENEIEILSFVRIPRRLVNLIGFTNDHSNNKLIVVEYMPNGSLHDLLHSTAVRPPAWTVRVRLALQVAKAVQAIHSANPPVIHRDIKSSNVMIDDNLNARLGDFGLAIRGHVEDVRAMCTPPAGTLGYLDPCYLAPEDLSSKSDVFSFGILLLEITSGRNAIDVKFSPPSVVDWAVPLIRSGEFSGICDPRIGAPPDKVVVRQLAVLAARCVRSSAERRPSMAEVVECLKVVRKRVHALPIWRSLKRSVAARGERLPPLVNDWDGSEEAFVRVVRGGSRRKNGKVSSVPGVEYEGELTKRAVRSKSVGSGFLSDFKMESDLDPNMGRHPHRIGSGFGRTKGKMAATRLTLKRSRSVGFSQSPRLLHHGSEDAVARRSHHHNHNNNDSIRSTETAMSKLVIADKKLEECVRESVGLQKTQQAHGMLCCYGEFLKDSNCRCGIFRRLELFIVIIKLVREKGRLMYANLLVHQLLHLYRF